MQVLLQSKRLRIAAALPVTSTPASELLASEVRITASLREVDGTWRTAAQDDLVLAVALASLTKGLPGTYS